MTHQPDEAREEALRLIEETQCESTIDTPLTRDQIEGMYHFTLDEAVRLIALARASQAHPEQGEGKCYECGKEFGPRATFELGVAIGKKQAQSEPPAGWVIVRDVPVAYISGNGSGRLVWPDRVQSKAKHLFQPLYAAAPSPTGEKE